jgi:putative transposase
MDPPKSTERKRVDSRRMLDGIVFRIRSGCQWNRLPRDLGDDSTIHRTFKCWVDLEVLQRLWFILVNECEEIGGVEWEWQAADCAMVRSRLGGFNWPQPHGPG